MEGYRQNMCSRLHTELRDVEARHAEVVGAHSTPEYSSWILERPRLRSTCTLTLDKEFL